MHRSLHWPGQNPNGTSWSNYMQVIGDLSLTVASLLIVDEGRSARMGRPLRWLLVVAPLRMWDRAHDSPYGFPTQGQFLLFGTAAGGCLIGVLSALSRDGSATTAAETGGYLGFAVGAGSYIYAGLVAALFRLTGTSRENFLGLGWDNRRRRWWEDKPRR